MSNNKARQVYTSEFKREAIELVRTSGKSLAELERVLRLSQGLLKDWVRQAKVAGEAAFPGQGCFKAGGYRTASITAQWPSCGRNMLFTWFEKIQDKTRPRLEVSISELAPLI